jgi:hypothetical protein
MQHQGESMALKPNPDQQDLFKRVERLADQARLRDRLSKGRATGQGGAGRLLTSILSSRGATSRSPAGRLLHGLTARFGPWILAAAGRWISSKIKKSRQSNEPWK